MVGLIEGTGLSGPTIIIVHLHFCATAARSLVRTKNRLPCRLKIDDGRDPDDAVQDSNERTDMSRGLKAIGSEIGSD